MAKHTSEISIKVALDENRIPEKLYWSAPDGGIENEASKALLLSVWDHNAQEALRIDLWTKDMPLDEMKVWSWAKAIRKSQIECSGSGHRYTRALLHDLLRCWMK